MEISSLTRYLCDALLRAHVPQIASTLFLVAFLLHWFFPAYDVFHIALPVLGTLFVLVGFGLLIAGWWRFIKAGVTFVPLQETERLVIHGPYHFTRNPLYLGVTSLLLGIALCVGTLPFYLAAILYFLIMDRVYCPFEEAKLSHKFGREYLSYKAHVRRWL